MYERSRIANFHRLIASCRDHAEPQGRATTRNNLFSNLMQDYSERVFQHTVRLSKPGFLELWNLGMSTHTYVAPKRSPFDPKIWLAAVLYQLGHGVTSKTACQVFGISEASYSEHRTNIIASIIAALEAHPDTALGWPRTVEGWKALSETFVPSIFSRFVAFAGVVAAGDGTLIPVDIRGIPQGAREIWRCRKGYFAQNALVFFDGQQRIICAEIMHEGSSADSDLMKTHMATYGHWMPNNSFILFDSGKS